MGALLLQGHVDGGDHNELNHANENLISECMVHLREGRSPSSCNPAISQRTNIARYLRISHLTAMLYAGQIQAKD